MSLKGLRFTLEVDGQEPDTFAVVNFRLIQNQSYPFVMSVDVASDSFMQTAEMLLEKNATLTIWQGVIPQRYVTGAGVLCPVRGKRPGVSGAAVGGGGDFLL